MGTRLRDAGWRVVFTPEVEIIHEIGVSTGRSRRQLVMHSAGIYRYYRKHRARGWRRASRLPLAWGVLRLRAEIEWLRTRPSQGGDLPSSAIRCSPTPRSRSGGASRQQERYAATARTIDAVPRAIPTGPRMNARRHVAPHEEEEPDRHGRREHPLLRPSRLFVEPEREVIRGPEER